MLKSLKNKFFKKPQADKSGNGLFATVEELIEQKQYVSYLKNFHHRLAVSRQAGDVKSAFKGRGIELEELRAYNYGDDVRDIDWRVTARKLAPFTRLYAEEKDREIYVLLDLSPYMVFGTRKELKSVAAAKIAALIGWLCLENKDRFGLYLFSGTQSHLFKPSNSRGGMIAMLKKISAYTKNILQSPTAPASGQAESVSVPLKVLSKVIKGQATVFVISDFSDFSDDLQKDLAHLSRKCRVFCIDVFDALEEHAPQAGEYMVSSGDGKSLIFNTTSKAYRTEYQDYFIARRQKVRDFCLRFGARYLEVMTGADLHKQLKIF